MRRAWCVMVRRFAWTSVIKGVWVWILWVKITQELPAITSLLTPWQQQMFITPRCRSVAHAEWHLPTLNCKHRQQSVKVVHGITHTHTHTHTHTEELQTYFQSIALWCIVSAGCIHLRAGMPSYSDLIVHTIHILFGPEDVKTRRGGTQIQQPALHDGVGGYRETAVSLLLPSLLRQNLLQVQMPRTSSCCCTHASKQTDVCVYLSNWWKNEDRLSPLIM